MIYKYKIESLDDPKKHQLIVEFENEIWWEILFMWERYKVYELRDIEFWPWEFDDLSRMEKLRLKQCYLYDLPLDTTQKQINSLIQKRNDRKIAHIKKWI